MMAILSRSLPIEVSDPRFVNAGALDTTEISIRLAVLSDRSRARWPADAPHDRKPWLPRPRTVGRNSRSHHGPSTHRASLRDDSRRADLLSGLRARSWRPW